MKKKVSLILAMSLFCANAQLFGMNIKEIEVNPGDRVRLEDGLRVDKLEDGNFRVLGDKDFEGERRKYIRVSQIGYCLKYKKRLQDPRSTYTLKSKIKEAVFGGQQDDTIKGEIIEIEQPGKILYDSRGCYPEFDWEERAKWKNKYKCHEATILTLSFGAVLFVIVAMFALYPD